jgi:DNA repair exonuclease SbcCD nuclease subunit
LVPGNHERSQAPRGLLALHPNIHIFDRPRTFAFDIKGIRLALGGFPFERENVRRDFRRLLDETGLMDAKADGRLLCLHQTVEGAVVGPTGYVFREGADVIRAADLPLGIEAVLSGHIHRFQALTTDLRGRPLAAPVFYPGSVERTSFAERDESKGYLTMEISTEDDTRGRLAGWSFHALPTRPMVAVDVLAVTMDEAGLRESIRTVLKSVPANGVVQVRLHGPLSADAAKATTADALRALTPPPMNVYVRLMDPPAAPSQVPAPASRGYTHSDIIVPPRRSAALSTRPPRKPQAASGWLFG